MRLSLRLRLAVDPTPPVDRPVDSIRLTIEAVALAVGTADAPARPARRGRPSRLGRDVVSYLRHEVLGESFAEIAETLGVTRQAVFLASERGRKIVRGMADGGFLNPFRAALRPEPTRNEPAW